MAEDWICMLMNPAVLRKGDSVAWRELEKVFGDDLMCLRIAPDKGTDDPYGFLKCGNYASHAERLKKSSAVRSVLPSFDSPNFLSDAEVDSFFSSLFPRRSVAPRRAVGDVVRVSKGALAGLTGLVVGVHGDGTCSVSFRFYLRKVCERLSAGSFDVEGNVFERIRAPVTAGTPDTVVLAGRSVPMGQVEACIRKMADECERYWERHREHQGVGSP